MEEVGFAIQYHTLVVRHDIPALPLEEHARIAKAIADKLVRAPEVFGKPLRRSLKGHWSLRVGDYRVVYRIERRTVKIFSIERRETVYEAVLKRI